MVKMAKSLKKASQKLLNICVKATQKPKSILTCFQFFAVINEKYKGIKDKKPKTLDPKSKNSFGIANAKTRLERTDKQKLFKNITTQTNSIRYVDFFQDIYYNQAMQKIIPYHTYEYGDNPEVIAQAPGRFHLLGEHLWFAHDDALSVAIDKNLYLSVSRRPDNNFKLYSASLDDRRKISASNMRYKKEDRWTNSVKVVISSFMDHGIRISGLNFTILSEIPANAGLGTPNALKVATGLVLRELFAPELSLKELADIIEYANIQGLSSHAHRADIYIGLFAKAGTCMRTEYIKKTVSHYNFPPDGYSLVLTDSKIPRAMIREELNSRVNECIDAWEFVKQLPDAPKNMKNLTESFLQESNDIPETIKRKVTYIIREAASVDGAVKALQKGQNQNFTRLITRSQEGLRDRFEISSPELDWLIKRSNELAHNDHDSLICARLTGKGFGGCTYSILRDEQVPLFAEKMTDYERFFGFLPTQYIVKSANGASIQRFLPKR